MMVSVLERDYIKDHYGDCALGPACRCLKFGPWLGRLCPNWHPTSASSWKEVKSNLREAKDLPEV